MDNHTLKWYSSSPLLIGAYDAYEAKAYLLPLHFNIQIKMDNTCQCICKMINTDVSYVFTTCDIEQAKKDCQYVVDVFCKYLLYDER